MKPIGICLGIEKIGERQRAVLNEDYLNYFSTLGHQIILIHTQPGMERFFLRNLSALVLTGGGDVPPELYSGKHDSHEVLAREDRCRFEMNLAKKAIEKAIPLFGICLGCQIINIALGGSLIPHIDEINGYLKHRRTSSDEAHPRHKIRIESNSLLKEITAKTAIDVNSSHHQACKRIGKGLFASAHSKDGIVEAIEMKENMKILGVQWHPEIERENCISQALLKWLSSCMEDIK